MEFVNDHWALLCCLILVAGFLAMIAQEVFYEILFRLERRKYRKARRR